jgi:hypothetical protein
LNQHNQSGSDEGGSSLSVLEPTVIRFSENSKKKMKKELKIAKLFLIFGETSPASC